MVTVVGFLIYGPFSENWQRIIICRQIAYKHSNSNNHWKYYNVQYIWTHMLFVGVLRDFNANGFYKIKLTDSSILYICVQKSEVYVYLKKEEATSQNWINKTIFFYEKKKTKCWSNNVVCSANASRDKNANFLFVIVCKCLGVFPKKKMFSVYIEIYKLVGRMRDSQVFCCFLFYILFRSFSVFVW